MNVYAMAGNDSVNLWDKLGLMVTATYDISKQTFDATSDVGNPVNCQKNKCSCGDNNPKHTDLDNVGPLPTGTYKIYQRIKDGKSDFNGFGNAWILDPQDKSRGDDMWGSRGRDGFRIHLWLLEDPSGMKGSNGCIVLSKDCHAAFEKMLKTTTKGLMTKIKSPKTRDKNRNVTEWEEFDIVPLLGTLTVK